ncbi:MAG: serine--tRNA ligase [bacterium]
MIDLKVIESKPEEIVRLLKKKGMEDPPIGRILELNEKRKNLIREVDSLRHLQNVTSREIQKNPKDRDTLIMKMREIAPHLKTLEEELRLTEEELRGLMLTLPNLPHESVPEGRDESENLPIRYWGDPPSFDFPVKDHMDLGEALDIIDIKRAAKVSGARFYYLKREAVILEYALIQFVTRFLINEGFIPVLPPVLIREEVLYQLGYLPELDEQMYRISTDELRLAGTSEHTVIPIFKDEVLDVKELPQRFISFSSCFRREAGAAGKDTRGILRVHQFDKLEMLSFSHPDRSWEEHEFLLSVEEKIMQELNIPYRVVLICAGDLGFPASKKYDIEAWMPGQNRYRETHSCSNCTDFQARRLNIRYRDEEGNLSYVHTLNGTALAIGRTLIAIIENNQRRDGSIKVPNVLTPYTGFGVIER